MRRSNGGSLGPLLCSARPEVQARKKIAGSLQGRDKASKGEEGAKARASVYEDAARELGVRGVRKREGD